MAPLCGQLTDRWSSMWKCVQKSGPDYGITWNQISEVTVFVQLVYEMKLNLKKERV